MSQLKAEELLKEAITAENNKDLPLAFKLYQNSLEL